MSSARIWISWMRWINCWPFRVLPGQLPFIFMPPRKSFRRKNCLAHRPLVTYSPWPLRHSSSVFFLPRVFCFEPFFFHANKNQHILFSWHVGSGGVPFFFLKKTPPNEARYSPSMFVCNFWGPGVDPPEKKKQRNRGVDLVFLNHPVLFFADFWKSGPLRWWRWYESTVAMGWEFLRLCCPPPKTNGWRPKLMVWKRWIPLKYGHLWHLC